MPLQQQQQQKSFEKILLLKTPQQIYITQQSHEFGPHTPLLSYLLFLLFLFKIITDTCCTVVLYNPRNNIQFSIIIFLIFFIINFIIVFLSIFFLLLLLHHTTTPHTFSPYVVSRTAIVHLIYLLDSLFLYGKVYQHCNIFYFSFFKGQ